MRKPSFGVTSFAVVTLSAIGIFRFIYAPLLPASTTEYLVTIPNSEPLPAPIVEINWKRSLEDGRNEAKRRKLGLLILFLDPSSIYAKEIETKAFREPEMARFVNRNFVPVKINLDQYPEWAQTVLPLQRLGRYFGAGVDIVITNQNGTLIDRYGIDDPFQYNGLETVLPFLIRSKTAINTDRPPSDPEKDLRTQQNSDINKLQMSEPEPLPAFADFQSKLEKQVRLAKDGSLLPGAARVQPLALRVMAKLGQAKWAKELSEKFALTPLYDAIDGGYFREARIEPNLVLVDTGKSSLTNSIMALVTAQIACAEKDPSLKNLALDIGNGILVDFVSEDSVSTSRMNDQSKDMRSRRSSLSNGRMGQIFSSEEQRAFLSYVSKTQSRGQDLPTLRNLAVLSDPAFERVRQTLREKIHYSPGLSEPDQISVEGYVAARLFDLYRLTDDERFLKKAQVMSEQVYSALKDGSVAKVFGNREFGAGWLGSYLAVADCGLSNYAATGEIYPLRNGETALKLAIEKFKDSQTGLLDNSAAVENSGFEFSSAIPDLADAGRESLNAQALRLAYHYSVTSESEVNRAKFMTFAQGLMVRLNSVMHQANSTASGYFDAAYDAVANQAVMVAGPNRLKLTTKLIRKFPFSVIYPLCEGSVPTKDEIFIRRGTVLDGPFTEDEIQKKLAGSSLRYPD